MGAAASPLSRGGSGQRHTHECIPHRAARVDDGVLLARGVLGGRIGGGNSLHLLVACGSIIPAGPLWILQGGARGAAVAGEYLAVRLAGSSLR